MKEKIGIVVSDKMIKTCIVAVSDSVRHKRYPKVMNRTKRYPVRDEHFNAKIGDKVRIRETRRVSKTVNWILTDILKRPSS
jgi:small subunit ribosomal protein S17